MARLTIGQLTLLERPGLAAWRRQKSLGQNDSLNYFHASYRRYLG